MGNQKLEAGSVCANGVDYVDPRRLGKAYEAAQRDSKGAILRRWLTAALVVWSIYAAYAMRNYQIAIDEMQKASHHIERTVSEVKAER